MILISMQYRHIKENINSNIYEGDLNDIYKTIPKHDILIAGFHVNLLV